jgi:hypothetical protein
MALNELVQKLNSIEQSLKACARARALKLYAVVFYSSFRFALCALNSGAM